MKNLKNQDTFLNRSPIKYGMTHLFTQAGFIKFTKRSLISLFIFWTAVVGTGLIYLLRSKRRVFKGSFGPWAEKTEAVWPALLKLQHEAYSNPPALAYAEHWRAGRIQSRMLKLRGFDASGPSGQRPGGITGG